MFIDNVSCLQNECVHIKSVQISKHTNFSSQCNVKSMSRTIKEYSGFMTLGLGEQSFHRDTFSQIHTIKIHSIRAKW